MFIHIPTAPSCYSVTPISFQSTKPKPYIGPYRTASHGNGKGSVGIARRETGKEAGMKVRKGRKRVMRVLPLSIHV